MKPTVYLLLLLCLFLSACDDDNNSKKDETLVWIEDEMKDHYYWDDEIPNNLNYTADPEVFFMSLLSQKDGKTRGGTHHYYSYIEKADQTTRGSIKEDYTYGLEFIMVTGFGNQSIGDTYTAVLVLYVYPGTPAADAGIKRGDWIIGINGQSIKTTEQAMSLFGDVGKEFTIAQWTPRNTISDPEFINKRTVSIGNAEPILNYSPVYMTDVITTSKGKRVGYMIYDRFEAGKDDDDTTYDDELRQISNNLNGVDEFVLDLRYNNGGLLSCACLLSAILGPNEVLTTNPLGYLEYTDGSKGRFQARLGSGTNLNLSRLYVLTSGSTASASEAVINLLDPLMEVIVIGEKTEGKNVGSEEFVSEDKVWTMHPITSKIFNSEGKSDYVNGWTPNHPLDDVFLHDSQGRVTPIERLEELGNPEERLLQAALYHIDNGRFPTRSTRAATPGAANLKVEFNSLSRKATPVLTGKR